jgi:hypothetical protein
MQRKLLILRELQFQNRTPEYVKDAVVFGTSVAKTIWEEKVITDWEVNLADPNPQTRYRQSQRVLRQGTKVKVVNLAKFLPDRYATNGDVAGVGTGRVYHRLQEPLPEGRAL